MLVDSPADCVMVEVMLHVLKEITPLLPCGCVI